MVSRSEIKHNFLKQIIFRLDYKGIMDTDVNSCVSSLREKLVGNGFSDFSVRTENHIDFQVKMELNIPVEDQNPFYIQNTSSDQVFSFKSEDEKNLFEISKSFMTLTICVDEKYDGFDPYLHLLVSIIDSIKNTSPFFKVIRIGLRKINLCFIENLNDISKYFKKGAFSINETMECMTGLTCKASNTTTILEQEPYQINYIRNIQAGIMQIDNGKDKVIYQLALDCDVFCDDIRKNMELLSEEKVIRDTLITQNTVAYNCYINSLTEEFIEKLTMPIFDDTEIKDVI